MHRVAVLLRGWIENPLGIAVLEFDRHLGVGEYAEKIDEVLGVEADVDLFSRVFGGEGLDRFALVRRGGVEFDLARLHGEANGPGPFGGEQADASKRVEEFDALGLAHLWRR